MEGIAIVGMSGRFPGAPDLDAFWKVLVEKRDTITRFGGDAGKHDFVGARGVLEDAAMFDADFFGIAPRDADRIDPQHRLFLEACSNALEDAGYVSAEYAGEIGLFAGCSLNTYLLANLAADRSFLEELTAQYQVGEFPVALGNDKDFLTTRAAYKLNLRGPVMSVQAACATSLVAICQASQALLNYQCDMVLAGGVSVTFPQERGHVYQEGGLASRDGRCRPFDAQGTGTVFGHGVGVIVLKRMEDALRDGDHIEAVIRGFAVNNDGSAKAGYMAPGVHGQARVIAAAQAMAGISPETITYVEAHGTGTPLGDPIEIAALTKVFGQGTKRTGFCAIGTAKGNVGHLDAAAGVTGVIKTVLSMRHRLLPGLMHFEKPNPKIDLSGSPFCFSAETCAWHSEGPRRAGVSAFGVGGVNAHIVLEEPPCLPEATSRRRKEALCVSGRSEAAVREAAAQLGSSLEVQPETSFADAAYTLSCGRKAHEFRIAMAAEESGPALTSRLRSAVVSRAAKRQVAFLFPGQGSQFAGMGKNLYETERVYRETVDEAANILLPLLGMNLRDAIFSDSMDEAGAALLEQTSIAQPALFVTEFALAALWQAWGVEPQTMVGHSVGEYVAATLAGVMSLEDALRLVTQRGRMMGALPGGTMLSVPLRQELVAGYLSEEVSLAALNAPRSSVLAGPTSAMEELERRLEQDGISSRRLKTSHAFHSSMMGPMLAEFEAEVAKVYLHAPKLPFVSSMTGTWITDTEATSPHYWAQGCRQPVRFAEAVRTLVEGGTDVLLEVGPGRTLVSLAAQNYVGEITGVASFTAASGHQEAGTVEDALATLWSKGADIDWQAVHAEQPRRRVSLPTYPFERKLHWVAPPVPREAQIENAAVLPDLYAHESSTMAKAATPSLEAEPSSTRPERLCVKVAQVFAELSGVTVTPEEYTCSFVELGFDSLFLTQATRSVEKTFHVKVAFRQLMEELSTMASLAKYLDQKLPPEAFPGALAVQIRAGAAGAASPKGSGSDQPLEELFSAQIAAMQKMFAEQVEALRAVAGSPSGTATEAAQESTPVQLKGAEVRHGSFRPVQAKTTDELSQKQQKYLSMLISTYETKTAGSKRLTQAGRAQLADPRAVAGFRLPWKEMVYPLMVERAQGSRLWDVDDNEYIDLVNGYGCILFGHSPEFVVNAVLDQLDRGVAIGPQTRLAGEVAALICELTGNDRVTFCNTGSEAVMAAIRVARTVTGRDKLVYFAGDYHGTFDEVLVRRTARGSMPIAPGIPQANVGNVEVLEYGAEASLAYLRTHADEIAAVLIEPVQTRHPELQPMQFIRAVRAITEDTGSAMILDEVVTGFRLAPGGVQEVLGIRADLCTYGKVIGGGHPIGVLSGKRRFLDVLDGGGWQFSDDSGPEVGMTFFAGTFVRHPLALAAAKSVLCHLRQAGPALQRELNARTARLAESLDRFFVERGVPSRVHHFASWFHFTFAGEARLASLFYYAMRAKGIHIQESYPCFLTTAHTEADIKAIEAAFRQTIVEMQEGKVMPGVDEAFDPVSCAAFLPARVPLTEPQREIFLAAVMGEEANCGFNESITLHLRGDVQEEALERALETVLGRHDALRGTISEDGEWFEVLPKNSLSTSFIDLRDLEESTRDHLLAAAIVDEAHTPFDLARGPLLRSVCYRLANNHWALLLTAHHLVMDGWSANVLLEELGKVYSGVLKLAPVLPFRSYALRERERAEAGEFAANEVYWADRFKGLSPRLDLPTDRCRPPQKTHCGQTLRGEVGPELYRKLAHSSARTGCSLFVVLLSGFEVLLHRLTGQEEVVVGISAAGQALVEDASLVGHAVHFLPMLSEVRAGTTASEHRQATRTALLDAYDHQEFTFGSILRKLQLDRKPGRLPLIEVQFNLERVGENVCFDGLLVAIEPNPKCFVNTDLFLNVVDTGSDLQFTCDYNTGLFDESTIARWLESWTEVLSSSVAAPDTRVDELPLLGSGERQQLISDWNQTAVDWGEFRSVAALVLARAEREPGRVALECGGVVWTYARLAEYSLTLAQELRRLGLPREGLVGLCLERSPEMVAAMLAVMLAGGAYVPLDPRHPRQRLEMVLNDAGVQFLLTLGEVPLTTSSRVLDLTKSLPAATHFKAAALTADSLAYVIYTSGSTGWPKGVAVEHGALHNLLRSMEQEPGLAADDTLAAVTTLAFDIAELELLLPLVTGARLIIATDAEVADGRKLLSLIERTEATVLQATPGAWRLLIDAGWTKPQAGRRALKALCGGEALPRELADQMLARAAEVWNMYGPTETTIWSSATRVKTGAGPLRLGTPLANTQFYVLSERGQLAAIGTTGELFIAGGGLARGYWSRPELTQEKFCANPFSLGRIYASGDLARRRADGTIELLGRTDFQVKLRGYRIELQEIEAALQADPQVRDAVVTAHVGAAAATQLIAYVTSEEGEEAEALSERLAHTLRKTLPEYMIPAEFVVLQQLPRTANGKIDRKALPAPSRAQSRKETTAFVSPVTSTEKLLAKIWSEVLELGSVGVTDSLFEVGADSLLIFRIAARAQREGLPVTATLLFQQRTIAGVCEALEQSKVAHGANLMPRIQAVARERYRIPREEGVR